MIGIEFVSDAAIEIVTSKWARGRDDRHTIARPQGSRLLHAVLIHRYRKEDISSAIA